MTEFEITERLRTEFRVAVRAGIRFREALDSLDERLRDLLPDGEVRDALTVIPDDLLPVVDDCIANRDINELTVGITDEQIDKELRAIVARGE